MERKITEILKSLCVDQRFDDIRIEVLKQIKNVKNNSLKI